MDQSKRDVLKVLGATAISATVPGSLMLTASAHGAQPLNIKVEPNAQLRVMRWKRFVKGDEDLWMQNTEKFTQATGIKVQVDNQAWEDVRTKAAVAINAGSGPDIILGWLDDPQLYPDKLTDITDIADYLGNKYGGWYDVARKYGTYKGKWVGLPVGASGALLNYRTSWVRDAGFDTFPTDYPNYLKLCQALAKNGHPPGFALSHATGDSETWTHNILWGFGGKLVDQNNRVVINSQETVAALEYVKELYKTFIEGTLGWNGVSNNSSFLEGKIGLTSNGISIYYTAKNSDRADYKAIAEDMNHAPMPIGPVGHPTELHLLSQAMLPKYSKYPKAAKEYLRFMWEREQYEPWQQASLGYISQPLKAYSKNPLWTQDPKYLPFRDIVSRMQWNGYAGELGYASAGVLADWIVVDMFARVASGDMTPRQAAAEAERRARRYYSA